MTKKHKTSKIPSSSPGRVTKCLSDGPPSPDLTTDTDSHALRSPPTSSSPPQTVELGVTLSPPLLCIVVELHAHVEHEPIMPGTQLHFGHWPTPHLPTCH